MPAWLKDAVFYQVYPQSFYDSNADGTGDLPGLIEKLDYISDLGCNAIWINPCFVSPFLDAGYDVADYMLVAPRYGTNKDLIKLFDKAHERGLRVVLDLVAGHTSNQHAWFKKSQRHNTDQYADRYIWTNSVWKMPEGFRYVSGLSERDGNYVVNFFHSQPALNYGFLNITEDWQKSYTDPACQQTVKALIDVMRFWLDLGCDGFRVDMADSLVKNDPNKTATQTIWKNIRTIFDKDYPQAVLISEWGCPTQALDCGFHCDFYLDDKNPAFHNLIRRQDKDGKSLAYFSSDAKINPQLFLEGYLKDYIATRDKGYISLVTGNHDIKRMRHYLSEAEQKLAIAFILTMPGVPFIYYGDEIGLRYIDGLSSKEGGYKRTGSRTPMQWTGARNKGFSTARKNYLYLPVDTSSGSPNVLAQQKDKNSLYNATRDLLKIRHESPYLKADSSFSVLHNKPADPLLVYERGACRIYVNPSSGSLHTRILPSGPWLFTIGDPPKIDGQRAVIPPRSFAICVLKR